MVSKTISITENVYNLLSNMKLKDESFSDVIARLARARGKLNECAGLWGDMSAEELEEIKTGIAEVRRATNERLRGAAVT